MAAAMSMFLEGVEGEKRGQDPLERIRDKVMEDYNRANSKDKGKDSKDKDNFNKS